MGGGRKTQCVFPLTFWFLLRVGIETSCDETAAAVVEDNRRIRSSLVLSQENEHRPFGGVVPEIAARSHLHHIDRLVRGALESAEVSFADLDGVAATGGPGLIGGVIVGIMTAKAIAAVRDIPFVAVNHLEGHALTVRLTHDLAFPYLLLLVSGGHCQILVVEGVGHYRRLGTTLDDAAGEAFDKVAKMLGLGYPGGPALERAAYGGDPTRFALPRPMKGRAGCDFSFSGLKTAVRQILSTLEGPVPVADLAASFQAAVADVLMDRTRRALALFRAHWPTGHALVVAGGVAANAFLRERLDALAQAEKLAFLAPPLRLCTDNAAMIAWAGVERLRIGSHDGLDFKPRPRWPLDPDASKGVRTSS
ncbi:MAG: O-sialoglycoprotein endopeptidase [Rhodospirillaceae bacterium]|nr:MAG: O-sialoglycoprotein endopeptidase [Rhodospirillaceae bacterium]